MAHFDWTVIRCMDGRLDVPIQKYLEEIEFTQEYDLISLPGGTKDLQNPESELSKALENVSFKLHKVKKVLLIQHTDCGAYGGREKCGGTEKADRDFQISEIKKAMEVVSKRHPEISLSPLLIHIKDNGEIIVEELFGPVDGYKSVSSMTAPVLAEVTKRA